MKKFLVSGIFALFLLMTACTDKPVLPTQLPGAITEFILQNFPTPVRDKKLLKIMF